MNRVLDATPVPDLDAHVAGGGGRGLETARNLAPTDIIDLVAAAGLRGRGGAGFPTGTKWETVALYESDQPTTVVVNAAEGEPGSFKDRAVIRANPFRVLEGALIAARAVDAARVMVATKASFTAEIARLEAADRRRRRRRAGRPTSASRSSGDRRSTCSARRPPCSRSSPAGRRSPASPRRTAGVRPTSATTRRSRRAPTWPHRAVTSLRRWPTTSRRWPTCPASWPRDPTGSGRWAPRHSPGTAVVTITGITRRHGVAEVAIGTTLAEAIDQHRRRGPRGPEPGRGPVRRGQPDPARRRVRHAAGLRRDPGRRAPVSAPPGSSSSTTPTTSSPWPTG